ncbi:MAG: DNA-3-methyladenine glycosylase [Bacteroidota bacterium]
MSSPQSIALPSDYSFRESLIFLNRSDREVLHAVVDDVLLLPYAEADRHYLLAVRATDATQLVVRDLLSGALLPAGARAFIRETLDLDRDLRPLGALLARDPLLSPLYTAYRGLRLVRIPDLFQALAWTIIGQQINLAFAYTLKARLVEAVGTPIRAEGHSLYLFPSPEATLRLRPEELRAFQFSRQKIDYLLRLAETMALGKLSRPQLEALPERTLRKEKLLSLRGIGDWSAEYVLLKCLGDPSGFPITDVGLHNALRHLLVSKEKPRVDAIRNLAQGWKGWEGYVTFFLWRSLMDA